MSFLYAILVLVGYYAVSAALIAVFSRFFPKLKEISRKAYHLMACLSVFIFVFAFNEWYLALFAILVLAALVYTILPVANLIPRLKKLSIGRDGKFWEVLKQAGYFFLTVALLIGLIWGLLGGTYRVHIIVGVMVLGMGDAAAALVGKRYGKRKFKLPFFDTNKTIEGSAAMAGATFAIVFVLLMIFTDITVWYALVSSLIIALIGAFVEAVCIKGLDTMAIPLITALTSLGLFFLGALIQ